MSIDAVDTSGDPIQFDDVASTEQREFPKPRAHGAAVMNVLEDFDPQNRDRPAGDRGTLYDSGLRVGELTSLLVDHYRADEAILYVPGGIQKDYPTDASPTAQRIGLADDTQRLLSSYLTNRWKDSPGLFPSRSADHMSEEAVRNVIEKLALEAEIEPYLVDGTRGEPQSVTPHTLRHSVAYRMLSVEDGNTIHDVRKRLRHRSIQTTEQVYDHFDIV